MEIIKCPECGKAVSDQADQCHHCDCKLVPAVRIENHESHDGGNKKEIKGVLLGFLGLFIILYSFTSGSSFSRTTLFLGIVVAIIGLVYKVIGGAERRN